MIMKAKKVMLILMVLVCAMPCLAGCEAKRPDSLERILRDEIVRLQDLLADRDKENCLLQRKVYSLEQEVSVGNTLIGWYKDYFDSTVQPETKPEIKVGQVWEQKFNPPDDRVDVLEVGEKYVVYDYEGGIRPAVREKESFREYYKLVEQVVTLVEGTTSVIWTFSVDGLDPPQAKKKPYLHKNPNNDHWICSKHGDLDKDKVEDTLTFWYTTRATMLDTTYCHECYWETQIKLINQHITGVKEND